LNAVARTATAAAPLSCRDLNIEVAGRKLVQALAISLPPGSTTCVLGCNGAGKTLTLHTLAGLRSYGSGTVELDGIAITQWPNRALARRLGLLPQTTEDPFPSTVLATALIGRHPHIGFWQWENEDDRRIALEALAAVGLEDFAARDVATLSGGERRRVAIATMLTQNPGVLLLDEPINHLDPHHQIEVLRLFQGRARAGGTVMMSLHDAGLAARFADQVLLLFGNGEWAFGPSAQVLTEQTISRLYGMPVMQLSWNEGRTFVAL
jgi:iron complex transport system ATP-binding protein